MVQKRIGLNITDYEYDCIQELINEKRFFNMSDFMRTAVRNELERIKKENIDRRYLFNNK